MLHIWGIISIRSDSGAKWLVVLLVRRGLFVMG
jgi:hypothetical protein